MKKIGVAFFCLLLLVFCVGSVNAAASPDYVPGDVLVLLRETPSASAQADGVSFEAALASQASAFAQSIGARAVQTYPSLAATTGKSIVLLRSDTKSTEELLAMLEDNDSVLGASPNYVVHASAVPDDPRYGELWGMERIGAPQAWDATTGSDAIYVAVIDSGIKYDHVDLAANMGRDMDGFYGRNCVTGAWDPNDPLDDQGHGTHVAGSIGAVGNNGVGVAGVNWNVKLLAVKVLNDQGRGSGADIIAGFDYVLGQKNRGRNIRVANMSLGGWWTPVADPYSDPYGAALNALCNAGILVVVAAGNEYQDIDNPGGPGSDPDNPDDDYRGLRPYPACFPFSRMITVAAIDSSGAKANFSNYSPNYVHLAAPGVNILSTTFDGGYASWNGTSMATPYVAGAAALLMARYPAETADQIKARIVDNVAANANLAGRVSTGGELDLAAAMGGAVPTGTITPTPTLSPTPSSGGSGGGGGCSVGVVPGMLLLLVPLLLLRGKR
ncbi:S8 family peptidase [Aminiphilus sp.]|uniref:S8 family peptidase n=1 Tax=Aminiphilus sp. TaxID=1872488 RepID=UPI00262E85D4|nr:S8 family peptidase [Aminiphilus sp.]